MQSFSGGLNRMEKAMYPSLRLAMGAAALIAISMPTAALFAAQDAVVPPKLTWECDCPMSKLADPAALPHFAAALRQKNTVEIVAIGSSSTFGIGASTVDRTYPFQLQDILERTFKSQDFFISNSGIGGEVAAQTAKRVMNEVALKLPDLVLWQVGTNDVLAGVPIEEFKTTVQGTLRWLKYHGIDTVLIGLQYSPAVENNERHHAFSRAISEIAAEENVLLVRRYDAMRFVALTRWEGLLSGDGLHQNDHGYRCMAEHIAHAVVASAFSPDVSTAPNVEEARRMQP
jgi:acyl-CoA thioesterase-1